MHRGSPALCEPGAAVTPRVLCCPGAPTSTAPDGTPVHHHLGVSGFADYAVVSRRSLVKIDPDLPLEEAALFGCAVLTGVGAVVNTARMSAGASAAVIGLGGVGLASLLGAVAAGAREIVAIDLADDKLAFARELGATATFNAMDPDAAEQIKAAPPAAESNSLSISPARSRRMDLAFKITRRGGTTVTAGLPPPTATLPLPAVNLVAEERTLKGSYIGTCGPQPGHSPLHRRSTREAGCRSTG